MNYFKKNPIFFTALASLLLVFVVALAYNVFLFMSLSTAEADYAKVERRYKQQQSKDSLPKFVELSQSNIEEVEASLESLVKELSPNSSSIIKEAPMAEGYSFVEYLRGLIILLSCDSATSHTADVL